MFDVSVLYKVSNVIEDRLILEIVKKIDPKGLRPDLIEGGRLRVFLNAPDKRYVNEAAAFLTKQISYENVPGTGCDIIGYVYLPDSFGGAYLFGGDFYGKESSVKYYEVAGIEIMCNFLSTLLMKTQFQYQAEIDHLTGLFNSYKIKQKAEFVVRRFERKPLSSACIAMGDIDCFKKINDTYGHYAGDIVLKEVAQICLRSLRKNDASTLCRWGGDEFVALLPETDTEGAVTCAEHLRKSIENHRIKTENSLLKVTISCGVSSWDRKKRIEDLLYQADMALLKAKKNGKNCIFGGEK